MEVSLPASVLEEAWVELLSAVFSGAALEEQPASAAAARAASNRVLIDFFHNISSLKWFPLTE
uniref:hypothetical protein n=1 Tax=Clostridium sp. NkU-1 TaxID=1095009 RepID=UPI000B0E5FD8